MTANPAAAPDQQAPSHRASEPNTGTPPRAPRGHRSVWERPQKGRRGGRGQVTGPRRPLTARPAEPARSRRHSQRPCWGACRFQRRGKGRQGGSATVRVTRWGGRSAPVASPAGATVAAARPSCARQFVRYGLGRGNSPVCCAAALPTPHAALTRRATPHRLRCRHQPHFAGEARTFYILFT